jgi:hypothetical protein
MSASERVVKCGDLVVSRETTREKMAKFSGVLVAILHGTRERVTSRSAQPIDGGPGGGMTLRLALGSDVSAGRSGKMM